MAQRQGVFVGCIAAALPRCDWGISYEEGIGVRLPHMNGASVLGSLTCLRARADQVLKDSVKMNEI